MISIGSIATILVPAAGYGVRVGSPPAKELLLRPTLNRPLIDLPLLLAEDRGWPSVVIIRKDKQLLIDYLQREFPNTVLSLIDPTPDWPSTMLMSAPQWTEKNILFLPDVDFAPTTSLDEICDKLNNHDIVVANHRVQDPHNWGHLWWSSEEKIGLIEKPVQPLPQGAKAWGLLGFKREFGTNLFQSQLLSQQTQTPQVIRGKLGEIPLHHFQDLTRDQSLLTMETLF